MVQIFIHSRSALVLASNADELIVGVTTLDALPSVRGVMEIT